MTETLETLGQEADGLSEEERTTEAAALENLKQSEALPEFTTAAEANISPTLRVALADNTLDPNTFTVERANPGDAIDLRAALPDGHVRTNGVFVMPSRVAGNPTVISTGIRVEIPEGYAGLVLPRSGLAAKHGITILNSPGLIDSGYRGEIHAILANHGMSGFHVKHGDRIAQLLIVPAPELDVVMVDELSDSERGENGLGSSGVS